MKAMAMEIPLLTFGVGGIGEYIDLGTDDYYMKLTTGQEKYIIGKNAILLLEASPKTIALAATLLVRDAALRRSLGRAGRKTVQKYFSVERQLREYADLYLRI